VGEGVGDRGGDIQRRMKRRVKKTAPTAKNAGDRHWREGADVERARSCEDLAKRGREKEALGA
jgi:hypothetical protein